MTKTKTIRFGQVFATVALLLLAGGWTARADGNGAVVINDFSCSLLDGNGFVVPTTNTAVVITRSDNCNLNLKCQASVTPSDSGQAVQYDAASIGGSCAYQNTFFTLQWHETVSASGQATLVCHFQNC